MIIHNFVSDEQNTYMQKLLFISIFYLFSINSLFVSSPDIQNEIDIPDYQVWYKEMQLEDKVGYKAFEQALSGYFSVNKQKDDILTIIDFSKPSTEERFFVMDMKHKKLLYSSHVSHGRNSGENFATSFSNESGSFKSSLGFFLTDGTYIGKNGYSLVLNGLEKGINDKARQRAVVIHGAPYSNPSVIRYAGRLGRSLGCPALPSNISKPIIDTIKGGSLLYIYADDSQYVINSPILTNL